MLIEQNGKLSCSKRSRHLNVRYFCVTDAVKRKEMEIMHCPTEVMIADFFTKPLQGNLFKRLRDVILGHVPVSSLYQYLGSSPKERVVGHKTNDL